MYTYVDFDLVFGQMHGVFSFWEAICPLSFGFCIRRHITRKNAMQRYLWGEAIAKHIGKLEHEEPVTYVAFSGTIRDDV